MEKTIDERELSILKIVGKHPEIHHRELLKIILDKSWMAKKTAEKNIKNLLKEKRILSYKYGKEIQYVLADNELSEKDLKKKVSKTVTKFKTELDNIENDFDKFDFYVKQNFPDYLSRTLNHLVGQKSDLLRYAKENKLTDISFAQELLDEIHELSKNYSKDELIEEKITQSRGTITSIDKMQRRHAELLQKRSKLGSSKKRDEFTQKIQQLGADIPKLYTLLENIRDEIKSLCKK